MMMREIRFGTKLHQVVLDAVLGRKKASARKMGEFHQVWREAEEFSEGYIHETDADKIRKEKKKQRGRVDYTTIEVPYSYGMMMSAHTYMASVFLGRDPILQYTARHGEPQMKVQGVEALMGYQIQVGGMRVPMFLWLHDALQYGLGVTMSPWETEYQMVSEIVEKRPTKLGIVDPDAKPEKVRRAKKIKCYEGNRLINIKPYNWYPDHRKSVYRFQEGEFCGHTFDTSYNDVLASVKDAGYFNLEAVKQNLKGTKEGEDGENQHSPNVKTHPDPFDEQLMTMSLDKGSLQGLEMCVKLVPKDWGLGNSEYPEKWLFTVVNEKVIIGARPLGHHHGKYPYNVLEHEIEAYKLVKRGMPEMMQPINDIMTWLFNSHFYNVRASLNNQFVYDPTMVSLKDMMSDQPGFLAALKPSAQGKDVRTVMHQFPVNDVTAGHLGDFQNVGELAQRAFGVVDNVMGMVNPGGRKTATEVRTSSSFSVNRLKTEAEYMSAMGWDPLSQMMLQQTQQYYTEEKQFRILGDLTGEAPFVNVSAESIAGFYDFVPVDGTMPIDRFAQANLFREMLANLRNMPEVAARYDVAGMFGWLARLIGMRNIDQFRIETNDPGVLQGQAQQGNVVPVRQLANEIEPKQLPNMGPTG